jgi:hypothetical protein
MEPRKEAKQEPKAPEVRRKKPKRKLRIVKLEQRIAPGTQLQHNETLVREPAKPKPKLRIVKLEERIAPGTQLQHNETLVRDRSSRAR